jgi:two-component system, chemotaxis family, chemotaxis protein CheY
LNKPALALHAPLSVYHLSVSHRRETLMKTILLVDDSRAVRLAAKRMMVNLGFNTLEAEHGQEALKVIGENPQTDVVLLDWNMPVMDGITFLRALRADTSKPQPTVIMCTTENDMPRIIEAMHSGANEYIMKPFTEDIVKDKLQGAGVL